jgi:hypothetical protein
MKIDDLRCPVSLASCVQFRLDTVAAGRHRGSLKAMLRTLGENAGRPSLRTRVRRADPDLDADSGARRKGFREERENDSGVKAKRIPG